MMNSWIAKRLLISKGMQLTGQRTRYFASLNTSHIDSAISGASSSHGGYNWTQFFSGIKPSDVAGSDAQSVGRLLKALSYAGESEEAANQKELYNAIEFYFRK